MLADSGGRFTDKPFPGRGGAVNRAAGLLLAKVADLLADPAAGPSLPRHELPGDTADQRDLLTRIDSALPRSGIVDELAWTPPGPVSTYDLPGSGTGATGATGGSGWAGDDAGIAGSAEAGGSDGRAVPALEVPLVERSRLEAMIRELYEDLGAASFTSAWQQDPTGLLAAATAFLADLRLLRPVPGGVLVLPAAARYRNITLALPASRSGGGQLALGFGPASGEDPPP